MKKKLPRPVKDKLKELKQHLTPMQVGRMKSNLGNIVNAMAPYFGIRKGTIEYQLYHYQLAIKYIVYQYNELQKHLKSRYDRNYIPLQAITPKELFG